MSRFMCGGEKARVIKILKGERVAGYSIMPEPPNTMLGKVVTITRPITRWNGYWVKHGEEKYVFAGEELELVGE